MGKIATANSNPPIVSELNEIIRVDGGWRAQKDEHEEYSHYCLNSDTVELDACQLEDLADMINEGKLVISRSGTGVKLTLTIGGEN